MATATGVPTWRLSSFERGRDVPDPEEFAVVWNFLSSEDDGPRCGSTTHLAVPAAHGVRRSAAPGVPFPRVGRAHLSP